MTAGADLRLVRAAVFTAVCVTLSAAGHTLTGRQHMPLWSLGLGCAVVFAVAAPMAGRERSLPGIAALLAAGQIALHTLFACGRAGAAGGAGMPSASASGSASGSALGYGGAHAGLQSAELRSLAARLLCGERSAGSISESRARQVISDAGLGTGLGADRFSGHATHAADAGHTGHEAAGSVAFAAGTPLESLRSAAHAALSLFDGPMLIGHILAALVLGWFLHRGEAALWRLVRLSVRSVRSARTAVRHVRALLGTALAHVRALRGGIVPQAPTPVCLRDGDVHEYGTARSVLLHHSVNRRGPPRRSRHESFALTA